MLSRLRPAPGRLRRVLSPELAQALQEAGLRWQPRLHDRFIIPDRDLDGKIFALNDLSTEIHEFGPLQAITFNGAVEWSLDWILSEEVVWLPTEAQLREAMGDSFVALERTMADWRCRYRVGGEERVAEAASGADAYGRALLDILNESRVRRSA